jgi:hypothetical protein
MNCSIAYCFTLLVSTDFGDVSFFAVGVSLVIRVLFDTSGFRSGDGLWAEAITASNTTGTTTPSRKRREIKFDKFMVFELVRAEWSKATHS